jgi:hypothetical protein
VGWRDLYDLAASLTGSPATRRRTLSAMKALLTTGFKMGALRFKGFDSLENPSASAELWILGSKPSLSSHWYIPNASSN